MMASVYRNLGRRGIAVHRDRASIYADLAIGPADSEASQRDEFTRESIQLTITEHILSKSSTVSYDCTASFFKCSQKTVRLTSSVSSTSEETACCELYVAEGFNLANRKRPCYGGHVTSLMNNIDASIPGLARSDHSSHTAEQEICSCRCLEQQRLAL